MSLMVYVRFPSKVGKLSKFFWDIFVSSTGRSLAVCNVDPRRDVDTGGGLGITGVERGITCGTCVVVSGDAEICIAVLRSSDGLIFRLGSAVSQPRSMPDAGRLFLAWVAIPTLEGFALPPTVRRKRISSSFRLNSCWRSVILISRSSVLL